MADRDPIQGLVDHLGRLPGIGERTARRLVYHLIRDDRARLLALADACRLVAEQVHECPRCCMLTSTADVCEVCDDYKRDDTLLCVVATIQDQAALDATGAFRGRYHVLHGTLSPTEGIGPDALRIQPLLARLAGVDAGVKEVILATPPTIEGEATALYLSRMLDVSGRAVSRIATGVPVGGELQYSDRLSLARALAERRALGTAAL